MGLGAIIHDEACSFVVGLVVGFVGCSSVYVGERWALMDGLSLAANLCDPRLEVESGCLSLVNVVNCDSLHFSSLGSVILDALDLFVVTNVASFSFVPGFANSMAHRLARYGLSLSVCYRWIHVAPSFILDVLFEDSLHS